MLTSGAQEGVPLPSGRDARSTMRQARCSAIIGFSELSGLSVRGARWPLTAIDLPFGSSLTISNEVSGRLEIELGQRPRDAHCPPLPADPNF